MGTETQLYLIRHGEACGNVERRFHGNFNSSLTDNGREQVRLLANRLAFEPIEGIYSSDLDRALDTARVIAATKNLYISVDSELREINGGEWEDVPWDDLPIKFAESYRNWLDKPHLLEMPGGETMVGFQKRIKRAVDLIAQTELGRKVAIVTHGTAIKVLVCEYLQKPLSTLPEIDWYDNASITRVNITEDGTATVILQGDNSHLGDSTTLGKQTWWKK